MVLPFSTYRSRFFDIGISVPIFLASVFLIFTSYITMGDAPKVTIPGHQVKDFHYKYTVQKGVFQQSEDSTNDKIFDFTKSNFGLIHRSYPTDKPNDSASQWTRLEKYVEHLQANVKEHESYKVIFLGRHGQGWHNVAETKYGTKAWDCYWSALDGADNMTWADSLLTPIGEQQARDVNALWASQLPNGIPAPQTYYVSPLTRTLQTADLSFEKLPLPESRPYKPYVVELVREALGVHTCDRRSVKSVVAKAFPHATFEDGFSEEDPLWEKDYREPASARAYRLGVMLDEVFEADGNVWLSFTSHSGAIASLLEVMGHRRFALETGGVIPVLVKGERVNGKREAPVKEPSEGPPICDGPPEM